MWHGTNKRWGISRTLADVNMDVNNAGFKKIIIKSAFGNMFTHVMYFGEKH